MHDTIFLATLTFVISLYLPIIHIVQHSNMDIKLCKSKYMTTCMSLVCLYFRV